MNKGKEITKGKEVKEVFRRVEKNHTCTQEYVRGIVTYIKASHIIIVDGYTVGSQWKWYTSSSL